MDDLKLILDFMKNMYEEQDMVGFVLIYKNKIRYINPKFAQITGYSIEEWLGQSPNALLNIVTTSDRHKIIDEQEKKRHGKKFESFANIRIHTKSGNLRWVEAYGKHITFQGVQAEYITWNDIQQEIQNQQRLEQERENFQTLAEEISDGLVIIKKNKFLWGNSAFCRFFELDKNQIVGNDINGTFMAEIANHEIESRILDKDEVKMNFQFQTSDHKNLIFEVKWKAIKYNGETATKYLFHEITEYMNMLAQKEVLLKEVHHRVKNNMQIITSLFSIQSKYTNDPRVLEIFRESRNRITTMALIHEKLYRTNDFTNINYRKYAKDLVRKIIQSFTHSKHQIEIEYDIGEIYFSVNVGIPLGLVINELVSNSVKYAFAPNTKGKIKIILKQIAQTGEYELMIQDNGVGMPSEFDIDKSKSLGLRLIQILSRQLNGTFKFETKIGDGVKFTLRFSNNYKLD